MSRLVLVSQSYGYAHVLAVLLAVLFVRPTVAEETRSFLIADSSKKNLSVIDENGEAIFNTPIGPLHDLHALPEGRLLLQSNWQTIVELNRASGETEWKFAARDAVPDYNGKLEVHAFQRLENGNTMIAISGPSRMVEVTRSGDVVTSFPFEVAAPHPHRDTRLARKLANGHYLVCHEGDGRVCEYDGDGAVVWSYRVPLIDYPSGQPREPANGHGPEAFGNQCFSAIRLAGGNTLIGTGNGHAVIEVTPSKEIVWSVGQRELPGITLAWVTTLEVLPSGNIVIGNCHAGPDQPQLVEVDREKHVVWTFHDFERFGNATTNNQILTVNGESVLGRTQR